MHSTKTDFSEPAMRWPGRKPEISKPAFVTWVRVGSLRTHLLKHLTPEVRDVVIAGENRDYIAVLGIPSAAGIVDDDTLQARVRAQMLDPKADAKGRSLRVLRSLSFG